MKKNLKVIALMSMNVLLVSLLRQAPYKSATFKLFIHVLTMSLILVMIFAWAMHIQQYIVQTQLKRTIGYISMLMMLWMFLRFTRYYLFDDYLFISRHLWYLYYIPMIYIPLNTYLFSLYFGRSITWNTPNKLKGLNIISLFFLFLVLFNDKLQLIFIFEDINNFSNYEYGTMYYLMIIYLILLILFTLFNLVRKSFSQRKNNLVIFPFIVLVLGMFYIYLYIFKSNIYFIYYFDLTLALIYINMLFWESVILSRLIPINQDHQRYFEQASFKAQIMNQNKEILFKNKNAYELSNEIKEDIIHKGHYQIDEHKILNSEILNQVYIIWEEDHQAIHESFKTKKEIQSELIDELSILSLDVEIQRQALTLSLKNEMYDVALLKVSNDIKNIQKHIKNKDLFKVTLLGIILKRKLNLILIAENNHVSSEEELFLSISEVFNLLNQHNYKTNLKHTKLNNLSTNTIYQAFETITDYILNTLDTHQTYNIKINSKPNTLLNILINDKVVFNYE